MQSTVRHVSSRGFSSERGKTLPGARENNESAATRSKRHGIIVQSVIEMVDRCNRETHMEAANSLDRNTMCLKQRRVTLAAPALSYYNTVPSDRTRYKPRIRTVLPSEKKTVSQFVGKVRGGQERFHCKFTNLPCNRVMHFCRSPFAASPPSSRKTDVRKHQPFRETNIKPLIIYRPFRGAGGGMISSRIITR